MRVFAESHDTPLDSCASYECAPRIVVVRRADCLSDFKSNLLSGDFATLAAIDRDVAVRFFAPRLRVVLYSS